jgi:hypothetical protein
MEATFYAKYLTVFEINEAKRVKTSDISLLAALHVGSQDGPSGGYRTRTRIV